MVGGHPALSLHSSDEPGESGNDFGHDDSTINIVMAIIIIIIIPTASYTLSYMVTAATFKPVSNSLTSKCSDSLSGTWSTFRKLSTYVFSCINCTNRGRTPQARTHFQWHLLLPTNFPAQFQIPPDISVFSSVSRLVETGGNWLDVVVVGMQTTWPVGSSQIVISHCTVLQPTTASLLLHSTRDNHQSRHCTSDDHREPASTQHRQSSVKQTYLLTYWLSQHHQSSSYLPTSYFR